MTGLDSLIAELKAGHAERNPRSAAAFESALRVMPGGNSRTQLYYEPFPFYVDYAEGPYLYDLDGHRYLDVVNNYTSLIHGHPDAETVRVIAEQAARGTAHAAPAPSEIELAEEITGRVTSMEMVRFTNSGSEAVLYAIRLARHVTGRADVIKVEGGYHGGAESVQVSVKRLGPDEPTALPEEGVPESLASATHVIPFDDIDQAVRSIGKHGPTSAALIVEPIQGFGGGLRPPDGYLEAISKSASDTGTLVIFDEIQTLRYAYGGVQQILGLTPDLTVLGKLIGGGLPVGAFGGSEELMSMTDPRGRRVLTQSGTFNANPLTMATGVHALRKLTPAAIDRLNSNGDDLPTSYRQARGRAIGPLTALFYLLMERGVFTAPSRVIVAFSTAMGDIQLDDFERLWHRHLTFSPKRCPVSLVLSNSTSRGRNAFPRQGDPLFGVLIQSWSTPPASMWSSPAPPPIHSSLQFWNPVPVLQGSRSGGLPGSLRIPKPSRYSTRDHRWAEQHEPSGHGSSMSLTGSVPCVRDHRIRVERQTTRCLQEAHEEERKMKEREVFPPGWDEERVQRVLQHYETLSEEEAVAEDESAFEESKGTVMEIPQELVPAVRMLLAERGG